MALKFLWLFTAVGVAFIASLTFVRAPDWIWAWKLAILAGEYGHWLMLVVIGVAIVAGVSTTGVIRGITFGFCLIAAGCFLRASISASRIAAELPGNLRVAFGVDEPQASSAFEWKRLYRGTVAPAAQRTTEVFSQAGGLELLLDFYRPAFAKDVLEKPRPCVVVIHGGGWDGGDRTQLDGWNPRLVAEGYAVAAISYRLAPQSIWPAQRDDVLAAIAWLKANSVRLGIDPTRLVLFGRSAGGQLATAVAYGVHDPAIRGVIALYAPHDMPFTWSVSREDDALNSVKLFRQYFGGAPDTPARSALYAAASGQLLAQADSPPTLLVHGVLDTLAWSRHSERLNARLQELGVRHCYVALPWATHGCDFNPDGPAGQLTEYAIRAFLSAELGNERATQRL